MIFPAFMQQKKVRLKIKSDFSWSMKRLRDEKCKTVLG